MAIKTIVLSRFRRPIQPPYRMLGVIIILFFMLGGGLIAAMLNMEGEIVNGPNRPLQELATSQDSWLIEKGTTNLVDDSFISSEIVSDLQSQGLDATGFTKTYRSIESPDGVRQVIVFDVPTKLTQGEAGVVVDESLGLEIGERFVMSGESFTATGLTKNSSSLGKEGIFLSGAEFRRLGMDPSRISGVFIRGGYPSEAYSTSYAVYTAAEFEQANLEYWSTNGGGLPLLLAGNAQIYSIAVVLCAVALGFALTLRSVVMLRAIGMTNLQVATTETAYLALLWLLSLPLQLATYWFLVGLFKSTPGYKGELQLVEFAFGAFGMLLVVTLYFALLALYSRLALKSQLLAGKLASS